MTLTPIRRALISVSDKTGLLEVAHILQQNQVAILSTGGTAKFLHERGIPVTEISEYTGFPEIMDGRVKTLHPKIHGGLLGRRGQDEALMQQHAIWSIDLLIVNLYPFANTIAQPNCELAAAIENIDIGGVALLRAAAKNYMTVTVVADPLDYPLLCEELHTQAGCTTLSLRQKLALKAFTHTAAYDSQIANYLEQQFMTSRLPTNLFLHYHQHTELRYGENPHQAAGLYKTHTAPSGTIGSAKQWQGKPLSFNNLVDADTALTCAQTFPSHIPACVIVKHANPCGVALGNTLIEAYHKAFQTDPTSAFGGIIAVNQTLQAETASTILKNQFVEVIIAPHATAEALAVCQQKPTVRILTCGEKTIASSANNWTYHSIGGGLLIQEPDRAESDPTQWRVVSQRTPTEKEWDDLLFAWRVVKFVKSNAIVYARAGQTIGIGAGQMSRIDSARIASLKAADARLTITGAVMASDAFFPFRDSIDHAASLGISAVIQPGGSKRDEEVIAAADEAQIAMVFTGMRHFRH